MNWTTLGQEPPHREDPEAAKTLPASDVPAQRRQPQRLPAGIAAVLSVLSSSAVVIDSDDPVLRASAAARSFGLVKGDRLMVGELLALARQVRRDAKSGKVRSRSAPGSGAGPRASPEWPRWVPGVGGGGLVLLLAEDQTESRRVEEVRRDFVANVSHELKTPVGALALLAETVEDAADDAEAVRRFAGRMRQGIPAHQAGPGPDHLVPDQAAEPIPDPIPVELSLVVAEALDRCRMKANSHGIELAADGAPGLVVLGDEDLLVNALRNLLENAVAYSPEKTRVVVATRRTAGDVVEISVTDQGSASAA